MWENIDCSIFSISGQVSQIMATRVSITVTVVLIVFNFFLIVSILSEGLITEVYVTLTWNHYHNISFKD